MTNAVDLVAKINTSALQGLVELQEISGVYSIKALQSLAELERISKLQKEDKKKTKREKYILVCHPVAGDYMKKIRTNKWGIIQKSPRDSMTVLNRMEKDRLVLLKATKAILLELSSDIKKANRAEDRVGAYRDLSLRAQSLWVSLMKSGKLGLEPPQSKSYLKQRIHRNNPYGYDTGEFVRKFIRWEFMPEKEAKQAKADYAYLASVLEFDGKEVQWEKQMRPNWREYELGLRDDNR